MKNITRFLFTPQALVLLILFLAIFVRFWKMEYIPFANDADEFAHILAGQSLIEYGQPISWSSFSHEHAHWQKIRLTMPVQIPEAHHITLINPWFDHTFFVPLLMGWWSHVVGYSFPFLPPALLYRLPFLLFALGNLVLVYAITKKMFGEWPAIFALTIMSFSPILIFAQRMVIPENITIFFILATLYLYLEKQSLKYLILGTVLAATVKVTGLIVLPILFFALWFEETPRKAFTYVGLTLSIVAAVYLFYGGMVDLPNFIQAMQSQSARLLGWSNPTFIFANPGLYVRPMLDFSYYFLLIVGFSSFLYPTAQGVTALRASSLAFLFTIWVTSAEQDMLGWYRIPLFIILVILSAHHIQKKNYFLVTLFLIITVISNLGMVRYPTSPLPDALVLRIVVGLILLTSLISLFWKSGKNKIRLSTSLITAVLVLYSLQGMYIAHSYFSASCKDRICFTPLVTFVQSAKELLTKFR